MNIETVAHLPLSRSVVCLDCEAIYNVAARACPSCGSESFFLVATWLDVEKERLV